MSPDPERPLIQLDRLGKIVASPAGPLTILDDISFSIRSSEAVAIVGVSGSGKSTLLGIMAGLDTATRGTVKIDGVDLAQLDEDGRAALRAGQVGFVFQSFQLLASMTALENVMLPLELAARPGPARPAAEAALARVGLDSRKDHYPNQLSGGEQQRVALARAFVTRPRLLFADEPTGNLDRSTARQVTQQLFDLRTETGATLVLVTHDDHLAARCGRIVRLAGGRLAEAQTP